MRERGYRVRLTGVVALALCLWLPGMRVEASWEWTFVPYVWVSDVSMDVRSRGEPVGGVEVDFSDLLDKVDYALQGHVEGRRGRGGLLLDLTYIQLGKTQEIMGVTIFPDIELSILEGGGVFNPSGESNGLDVLYGVRVIDIDQEVDIIPPLQPDTRLRAAETATTLVDGFAGLRYTAPIGRKGSFIIRGDVGAGDTDLTLNATGGFGIGLGQSGKYALLVGYRHMEIELEEGEVETDLTMSGPILGFRIRF